MSGIANKIKCFYQRLLSSVNERGLATSDWEFDAYVLEPRVLFSATPVPGLDGVALESLQHGLLPNQATIENAPPANTSTTMDVAQRDQVTYRTPSEFGTNGVRYADGRLFDAGQTLFADGKRLELVFIDQETPDWAALVDDLLRQESEDRVIEFHIIDSTRDGLTQVSETLSQYSNVSSVHIISHGQPGSLQLGNSQLDSEVLFRRAGEFAKWRWSLSEDADILIYGCDLASTASGREFVDGLAALCDCDVAASDDLTGHASLGGDWELEYRVGLVESSIAPSRELQATWMQVLATPQIVATEGIVVEEGRLLVLNVANGNSLSINDSDAAGSELRVTLSLENATATLANRDGLTFLTGDGTDDALLDFTGTLTSINQALDGLRILADPDFVGTAELDISVNDQSFDGINGNTDSTSVFAHYYNPIAIEQTNATSASDYTLAGQHGKGSRNAVLLSNGTLATVFTDRNDSETRLLIRTVSGTELFNQRISASGEESVENSIATDGNGRIYVTWIEKDGSDQSVFFAIYNSDGSTHVARTLVENLSEEIDPPSIAANSNGDFVIVYGREFDTIAFRRFSADGTAITGVDSVFGSPTKTDTAVAFDGHGNAWVAFEQGSELRVAYFNGTTFSTVLVLDSGIKEFSIAGNNSGDVVAVWENSSDEIEFQRMQAGSLVGVSQIASPNGVNTKDPSVAIDERGDFVISWVHGTEFGYQRFDRGGTQLGLLAGVSSLPSSVNDVSVAILSRTNIAFVYTDDSLSSDRISIVSHGLSQTNALPPTIDPIDNIYLASDVASTVRMFVGDEDTDLSDIVVTVNSNNTSLFLPSALVINGTGFYRDLVLDPVDGQAGTADVTVTATGNGLQYQQTFSVVVGSTIVVTTNSDIQDGNVGSVADLALDRGADGEISLREAIAAANQTPGLNRILFDLPGTGTQTIILTSDLPSISDEIVIDGRSQSGYTVGSPVILLDGNSTTNSAFQLVSGSSNSEIHGLILRNFLSSAIHIQSGSESNTISGNWIGGFSSTGLADATTQNGGHGIWIESSNNTIGGVLAENRNVIGGNQLSGIHLSGASASNNQIEGNYVGTTVNGNSVNANGGSGISLANGVTGTRIGGLASGQRNVLSGNAGNGIDISGNVTGTSVLGNRIGLTASGNTSLGNAGHGIHISGSSSNNSIGDGTVAGQNLIAFNGLDGVSLSDSLSINNAIRNNLIFDNSGLAIDLGDDGFTANDGFDVDNGANNLTNVAVIDSATLEVSTVRIEGAYQGLANSTVVLDFYSGATSSDAEQWLGSKTIITDGTGQADFWFDAIPTTSLNGTFITSTATVYGNTSELAAGPITNVAMTSTSAFLVNDFTTNNQRTSSRYQGGINNISINDSGDYAIVWSSENQSGVGWQTFAKVFDRFGNTISNEIAVSTDLHEDNRDDRTSVALRNDGTLVVVWTERDGLDASTKARVLDTDGNEVVSEFFVHSTSNGSHSDGMVRTDASGNFVVVWERVNGLNFDVVYRRFSADGTPLDASEVNLSTNSQGHTRPAIDVHADGYFVVAWQELDVFGNDRILYSKFNASGVAEVNSIELARESSFDSGPAVAMMDDGSYAIVYSIDSGASQGLWAVGYAANNSQSFAPIQLTTAHPDTYSIDSGNDGDLVVTWSENGADSNIWGQHISSNGALNGAPFVVTSASGDQWDPSVAALNSNNFVVVWHGDGGGDGSGVFARQFGSIAQVSAEAIIGGITIDGVADSTWASLPINAIEHEISGSASNASDLTATYQLAWNSGQLIVYVDVTDDVLIGDSVNPIEDDSIELFFDFNSSFGSTYDGTDDFHLIFDIQTATLQAGSNSVANLSAFQFARNINGSGYTVEASIDFAALGLSPSEFDVFGFDIIVNDDDTGGTVDTSIAWAGSSSEVRSNPSYLGLLVLEPQNNTPPTALNPDYFSLNENTDTTGGISVGTLATIDSDLNETFTYQIAGGPDAALFTIGGTNGDELFFDHGVVNYENRDSYAVIVRSTDSAGNSIQKTVELQIQNVNEAPTANDQTLSIAENSPNTSVVGTFAASDPDAGDSLSFAWQTPSASNPFAIDASSGQITVIDSSLLDFETTPSFSYAVVVTDTGGLSSIATATINLTGVNEAPFLDDQTVAIEENSATGSLVTSLAATDSDTSDVLIYSIVSGNDLGAFELHSDAGTTYLRVANDGPLDYETITSFSIGVQVDDQNGGTHVAAITVNLLAQNDNTPLITTSSTLAVNENSTFVATLTASDQDLPADSLTFAIVGTGLDSNQFEIRDGNQLYFKAAPDFESPTDNNLNGEYLVRIGVTDGANMTSSVFRVMVNDMPESPVASDDNYFVEDLGEFRVGPRRGLLANDFDRDGQAIEVVGFSQPENGVVVVLANGSFSYSATDDFVGVDEFTYTIRDASGLESQAAVRLDVIQSFLPPLPEPPATDPSSPSSSSSDDSSSQKSSDSNESNSEESTNADKNSSGQSNASSNANSLSNLVQQAGSGSIESQSVTAENGIGNAIQAVIITTPVSEFGALEGESSDSIEERLRNSGSSYRALASVRESSNSQQFGDTFVAATFDFNLLWNDLTEVEQNGQEVDGNLLVAGSAAGVTGAFTVGYVLWTVRSGLLVTSLIAQMPAWRVVDPLVVLDYLDSATEHGESDEVEGMFDNQSNVMTENAAIRTAESIDGQEVSR